MSRVFQLKLQAIEEEILKDGICEARTANMRVIEFQKRGLPHAHMLIILRVGPKLTDRGHVGITSGAYAS